MSKISLLTIVFLSVVNIAHAEVILHLSGEHQVGDGFVIDPWGFGTGDVTLSVENRSGGDLDGGLTFMDFSAITIVDGYGDNPVFVEDWDWTFPDADNPNLWFVTNAPKPQAAAFAGGIEVSSGEIVELAKIRLTAIPGSHPPPIYIWLNFGAPSEIFGDGNFEFLTVGEGSHSIRAVWYVPEPGTLALVMVAASFLSRRRI